MNWIHNNGGKGLSKVFKSEAYGEYCWSKGIGNIYIEESSGAFACGHYFIPADLTEEQIIEAIEKSVKDNHDYLLDLIAKPENKIVYKPGRIY